MWRLMREEGSEGPRHDPYHFTERSVRIDRDLITFHDGLGIWVSLNGKKLVDPSDSEELSESIFSRFTGLTIAQFDRAYNRVHGPKDACPKCHCKKLKQESGYPGEGFEICVKCGTVVNYYFNEGAII